ncbi:MULTISPECIES: enoyl-CoA hydratase/isomerase family protein [Streptomycetaceae]|uniref:Enoyl-CoA hydratase/isomerase n=1 Tax=Streptantibioticus cattleyicolor (strain ATCC 35852 / DSM 46488 / JCM 4925 / NBRC 14057 / NRRL 8057) TaxID=1003195 RepID=F8JZ43_STREN|nr:MULTISPECIES: enoyl-CoA hydratase/isomerase family protein [Streptomycetaceae]AEW94710.1 enoyl-CoA hydratase/isomerase [Streptantibioticus cattleyicolor NRRL 8057 = DSM 46488]MYS59341.1 enoyl-CoA hydratase/isomerase family protein [Streptomyces sp. SID5468]CCB75065.1 putative enoyl-CoA hydratase/isomerase [Streptantibioticus cattleyicolor NRRL 8057 = DSM 46488]
MTVRCEVRGDGIAVITLDRPERHNAIDLETAERLGATWDRLRYDDSVRVAVLTGAGDAAFCTGLDRSAGIPQPASPYSVDDPLLRIGPKSRDLWKPVIAAVNGMACGGAFYLLAECEFLIAAEHATFFDPHTTYGMVSAYESIGMAQRMPYGEVARMALMGTAERLGARRAHDVGLVSQVVPVGHDLLTAALDAATEIAGHPTEAVQGTVRALWAARELSRAHALSSAASLIALGNAPAETQRARFAGRGRGFRIR